MSHLPSPGDVSETNPQWLAQLKNELDSRDFCDAVVVASDGREFEVHRLILATRSSYFRATFTSPLNEDKSRVTINDVNSATMSTIINYMYTGTLVNVTTDNFAALVRAMDRLQVHGGLTLCHQVLIDNLNPGSCVIVYQLARAFFAPSVERAAKSFILHEFAALPADVLQELEFDEFHQILSDDRLNVRREEQTYEAIKTWISGSEAERTIFFSILIKLVRFGNSGLRFIENTVMKDPLVVIDQEMVAYLKGAQAVLYDIQAHPLPSKFDVNVHPFLRPRIPRDIIFVFGGWSASSATSAMETYDCRVNKWYQTPGMDTKQRAYHGMINFKGLIYVIGGFDGRSHFNSVVTFQPETKKWNSRANMNLARCYVSVTAVGNHIYAIGGYDGQSRTDTCERYNAEDNQWTLVASMNHQRSDAAAAILDGKIYVVGGFDGAEVLHSVEVYDPQTDQWALVESMQRPRSGVQSAAHEGVLYVFGGNDGVMRQTSVERYDPENRTWTMMADMKTPRSNFSAVILEGYIYIIGGFNGVTTIHDVECYDPKNNSWQEMWPMGIHRSALSACLYSRLTNAIEYTWLKRELKSKSGLPGVHLRRSPRKLLAKLNPIQ